MKKFVAVLAALVCVMGLSVSSLAYYEKDPSLIPWLEEVDGHYKIKPTIPASTLNSTSLPVWKEICSVLTDGSSSSFVLIFAQTGGIRGGGYIEFVLADSDYYYAKDGGGFNCLKFKSKVNYITVDLAPDGSVFSVGRSLVNSFNHLDNGVKSDTGYFRYILRGASLISPIPDSFWVLDVPVLEFKDDLGTFDTEEPEEPDPPSSSEPGESIPDTPKPPPYNPTIPTIPSGNQYVPYDTSIWNTFLDRIKTNIGSAANIGFLIFGLGAVWSILTRLVKRFTKAD